MQIDIIYANWQAMKLAVAVMSTAWRLVLWHLHCYIKAASVSCSFTRYESWIVLLWGNKNIQYNTFCYRRWCDVRTCRARLRSRRAQCHHLVSMMMRTWWPSGIARRRAVTSVGRTGMLNTTASTSARPSEDGVCIGHGPSISPLCYCSPLRRSSNPAKSHHIL